MDDRAGKPDVQQSRRSPGTHRVLARYTPELAGLECAILTKGLSIPRDPGVTFALEPGYHLRPEKDPPIHATFPT
jgi:hypothetical protein